MPSKIYQLVKTTPIFSSRLIRSKYFSTIVIASLVVGWLSLLTSSLLYAETVPPQSTEPASPTWQVSTSATYTSGNYGTSTTTTSWYVPLRIKRFFSNGSISVTVPFVSITSDGSVTFIGDDDSGQNRKQDNSGSGSSSSGPGSGDDDDDDDDGDDDEDDDIPGIRGSKTTRSGLGDVSVFGRYYLVDEQAFLPSIAGTGFVKFPTADEDKALGTGEFDGGFGIELSKFLTNDLIIYLDGGYAFLGEPPGTRLNDPWNYDVGLGYYITDSFFASVFYEESRAISAGSPNPRDVYFSLNHTISSMFRMYASGLAGLSDGAPDYSATLGVSIRF